MALYAHDLKRMLAYSTVSQLLYDVRRRGGDPASQFHLLSHAIFKALLCAGSVFTRPIPGTWVQWAA